MMRHALFLALALCAASCQKTKSQEVTRFTPDGSLKQNVAIVPVIDNSHSELPWSISEELTTTVMNLLERKGKLFLSNHEAVAQITEQFKESQDPFSDHIAWVKPAFLDNEYVVFLELVEHRENELYKSSSSGPADLEMAMRIRIFDLHGEKPQVILQEIVEQSYYIPKLFTRSSSMFQPDWGQEGFNLTPMGQAHKEFAAHIAKRIQQYISLQHRG